nr:hypothetical protein [uncultured Holophaga sp.]
MPEFRLGMAEWGGQRRLVAPLGSDPSRVVDLHRLEHIRQAKLGEGRSEALAGQLVPPDLRAVLESGPRGLQRARQALAYAEKWHAQAGALPAELWGQRDEVRMLPCLPDPQAVRRADGRPLDRSRLRGPGAELSQLPVPTLAVVGLHGGRAHGCCIALEDPEGLVLGAWLSFRWPEGSLRLTGAGHTRSHPLEAWEGLRLPPLKPAEVRLLPPPSLRAIPGLGSGGWVEVQAPFETMLLRLGGDISHPTVQ